MLSNVDKDGTTVDAELWWPRFMLNIDPTQDIAINTYTDRSTTLARAHGTKLREIVIWGMDGKKKFMQ